VTSCTFSGNYANYFGGGMYNGNNSTPTVESCTFSGNAADGKGGGMYNSSSSPTVESCTFSGNSAYHGGGMYNSSSSPTVTNCLLWGDTGGEIVDDNSTPTVTYSNVQGGYAGTGNINADPLFVWNLRLAAGSPCIDAANGPAAPAYDQDGNPRVDDPNSPNTGVGPPWVDMGAYEFQP